MADDAPRRDAALVALDWGTTTFRAWLLDGTGAVLDEVRSADGALTLSARADSARARAAAFEATFARLCRSWLDEHPGIPVLCSGMAGSNLGWADAGYLDVPAELGGLAYRLTVVPAGDSVVHLVPGLRATGAHPDVIRGEEVQLVGALAATSTGRDAAATSDERDAAATSDERDAGTDRRRTVVLPGTHSKWVRLDGGCVAGFSTAMTGELYGLLLRDSILGRLAEGEAGPAASDTFTWGLEAEAGQGDERGLPALLFTARTLVLADRLAGTQVADYLSGLLIGAEVRHALRAEPADVVTLCGSPSTTDRYRVALERSGVMVRAVGEDAAAHGLWRVALDAGLASLDTPEEQLA
ncbi:2-dehydro-3-deoxygalactonokinase [Promicromonospora sukumoe]|uniref:2-dehydro-3-deoxygalactonokinase n=1 Tax=Promicromonospora sukumoe TaxID=88382 RepID=A0A7W3PHA7_9MICO|nr:2-dehydro-3-deoxygalactonokinase [Promicromonospora sukumoe]MBA8811527.1 2-dehydro-3-deoxygalactonokinase [Promicromonospora sukumoe]